MSTETGAIGNGIDAGDDDIPDDATGRGERTYHLEIFLISFASLLLEISYTRVISFKLFYYYTYLVIGLALLGIGSGSVLTAISQRVRRARTDSILGAGCLLGATSVILGYLIVARIPVASLAVWDYGSASSVWNLAKLVVICLSLFAAFFWVGVMVSTLFGRKTAGIGKLYFADLLGAGLACAVVVSLISTIGPSRSIALAGAILAGVGGIVAFRTRSRLAPVAGLVAAGLAGRTVVPGLLPDVRTDNGKSQFGAGVAYSQWSPIFRVDVEDLGDSQLLHHDGLLGSVIKKWDGRIESLGDPKYNFDHDPRSFPFAVLGEAPKKEMIIGAAGGHEILASLYFKSQHIDAIELNPLTHSLVTGRFADYDGHVAEQPGVNYTNGDGRSFLARSGDSYQLIWYPAPDSYAASNAATAGAFVLSESYLYTSDTVQESLKHLTDDGIITTQFGEIDYDNKPNRTTRYVSTVRDALERFGVADPARHVVVVRSKSSPMPTLSTVLVKRTPFTDDEIRALTSGTFSDDGHRIEYAPGAPQDNSVSKVLTLPAADQRAYLAANRFDVEAISDDGPFFWHFARYGSVVKNFGQPIDSSDTEDAIGERVILLLLVLATVLGAIFLLLPFVTMRKVWTALPRKSTSALYFASLGLGFMFFEIALIQRLVLFLGYPTYSLTVTLASLLIFTGVGALLSGRVRDRIDAVTKALAPAVVVLGLAYLFALPLITNALLITPLGVRVLVAFVLLAPLGIFLGLFMPLGLGAVAALTDHSQEYVAWGWAVNGFASVIGSVLTTIIAMVAGFNVVLSLSMVVYLVALTALRRLSRPIVPAPLSGSGADTADESPLAGGAADPVGAALS